MALPRFCLDKDIRKLGGLHWYYLCRGDDSIRLWLSLLHGAFALREIFVADLGVTPVYRTVGVRFRGLMIAHAGNSRVTVGQAGRLVWLWYDDLMSLPLIKIMDLKSLIQYRPLQNRLPFQCTGPYSPHGLLCQAMPKLGHAKWLRLKVLAN